MKVRGHPLVELLLLGFLACLWSILAITFDFYETLHAWLVKHEQWELDELFVISWFLALLIAWYTGRRYAATRYEANYRAQLEETLRQAQTELAAQLDRHTAAWQQINAELQAEIVVREQVEQELQQTNQQLEQTQDLYRRAIIAVDAVPYEREYATDSFVFMGDAIEEITGYAPHEVTAELWNAISVETIMRGDAEGLSVAEAIERTRSGEFHRWRCDTRIITRSGGERWVVDASIEVFDEQQRPRSSIGILFDITDRKQAELELQETNHRLAEALAQLQQTQQQLIQQERLSAMGTMSSGIAHDFNNLLAPILGFTELLLLRFDSKPNADKERRYLQAIHTAAQNAAAVISRLREFYRYRPEAEPQLPVDLHQVVEQAILLTQPHWKDQALADGLLVQIETDLQPVPLIAGNMAELQEMLANLILNAVYALTDEGKIFIRVYVTSATAHQLTTQPAPESVVLTVSDTGAGMDEETQRRCFEPFFSTKGNAGTGLGLAAVYGIVQRHHGKITIMSTIGKGTTFSIHLPVPAHPPAIHRPVEWQTIEKQRILVVEDDELVREVIVAALQHGQHAVTVATNGWEGLEKFRRECFDLVITDRAMPKLNGDGVAAALQEMGATVPVILLTGFGEFMNASDELPKGVDYVISKPFTLDTLQNAIAQAMSRAAP
ncbi:MAG: response regulator [Caldilineaceae bacterium]|nr:response regulator [Caldilineaceae bacterium]